MLFRVPRNLKIFCWLRCSWFWNTLVFSFVCKSICPKIFQFEIACQPSTEIRIGNKEGANKGHEWSIYGRLTFREEEVLQLFSDICSPLQGTNKEANKIDVSIWIPTCNFCLPKRRPKRVCWQCWLGCILVWITAGPPFLHTPYTLNRFSKNTWASTRYILL